MKKNMWQKKKGTNHQLYHQHYHRLPYQYRLQIAVAAIFNGKLYLSTINAAIDFCAFKTILFWMEHQTY